MILTDDNFATIVKAVELGRALYDSLVKYIRFQMARLSRSSSSFWVRRCSTSSAASHSSAPDATSISPSTCSWRSVSGWGPRLQA